MDVRVQLPHAGLRDGLREGRRMNLTRREEEGDHGRIAGDPSPTRVPRGRGLECRCGAACGRTPPAACAKLLLLNQILTHKPALNLYLPLPLARALHLP